MRQLYQTFSKPGWIVVAGFILSFILAMIFVEPVKETVPKEKKEITHKQEQKEAERLAEEQKKKEEAARLAEEKKEQEAVKSVYYKNCDAVRSAGAAPVYKGTPGYGKHLDRDGDGIGCDK
ncbi:excalibur calcium-binding domain-containing protein [Peribacillus simplex]